MTYTIKKKKKKCPQTTTANLIPHHMNKHRHKITYKEANSHCSLLSPFPDQTKKLIPFLGMAVLFAFLSAGLVTEY